jgi:hypothetical protein
MKAALEGAQSQFKRYLGERGIYLLCFILGVKIFLDGGFSTMVWTKLDQVDQNMRAWVKATNELIAREHDYQARANEEIRAEVARGQAAREAFQRTALANQQQVLNELKVAAYALEQQQKLVSDLLADVHNFMALRGYDPLTAQEFDRWVLSANQQLRSARVAVRLPLRPQHQDPRLHGWTQGEKIP